MLETRLIRIFEDIYLKIKERYFFFQTTFVIAIFFVFLGFLFGNLFGTFLQIIRHFIQWDGFIVTSLLVFIEILSYSIYHRTGRSFLFLWKFSKRSSIVSQELKMSQTPLRSSLEQSSARASRVLEMMKEVQARTSFSRTFSEKSNFLNLSVFLRSLNYFKIGVMLGFFVDAFKVGS
jgi:hypothetical protein